MEQDGDSPPTFWFQLPIQTRRRPPPSPLFNPVVLIILLPILFLLIIFFLLPPFLTHTSQIIKPTSVKKSWDSLNIFLVLFAVLCGVFARRNDDVPPPPTDGVIDQVNHSYNRNRQMYSSTPVREPVTGGSRLRRNSSSYPDLRQESSWETGENRFRFLDDFDVNRYSSAAQTSEYSHQRPPRSEVERDNTVYRSPASTRPSYVVEKENGLPAVSDHFHGVPRRRNEVERENDVYRSPPSLRRSEVEIGNVFHRSQSVVNFHNVPQRTEVGRQNDVYQSPPSSRRSEVEIGNIMHRSQSAATLDYFPDPPRPSELERDYSEVKEIPVDTFQVHRYLTSPLNPKLPAPEPPPLPPVAKFKPRNSYHSVRRKEKVRIKNDIEADLIEKPRPPPPAPPPPPPPPLPIIHRSETKLKKLDRQISDATKEIATAFTSLYNQRKRKKKSRTRNIHDNATLSPQSSHSSPEQIAPPPPPPPPLPPPPSVFQNMFKKRTEHKRIPSVAAVAPPPPSPPPLPPSSIFNNLFKSGGKSKRFSSSSAPPPPPPPPPPSSNRNIFKSGSISKRNSSTTPPPAPPPLPSPLLKAVSVCTISDDPIVYTQSLRRKSCVPPQSSPPLPTLPNSEHFRRRPSSKGKPPLPSKASNYYEREEYITNSGSQSPLFPIPPPPPPPFKMSELKFKIRGDFVSLRSAQSSVCNSPDRENNDFTGMQESLDEFDGGDVGPVVFPPSPDVNVKADSFISRLKDEWRMEKVNSIKSRRTMGHGILGLDPELSPK